MPSAVWRSIWATPQVYSVVVGMGRMVLGVL